MQLPPRRVAIVSLAVAATLPGDALLYAVLPVLYAELGLELWMVGALLAANRAVRLVTNPLAGLAAQRFGIHRPFTLAIFLTAAVTAAYAAAPGFAVWLALRLAWGALWSVLRLGGFLAALAAGEIGRGYALGFYNGVANIGTLLAMATGGFLTDRIGLEATLLCFAAVALPAGLAMWREGPGPEAPSAEAEEAPAELPGVSERWGVYALALLVAAGGPLVVATLGLVLAERFGPSIGIGGALVGTATVNGLFLGGRFALNPVWAPFAGHLSDRIGRLRFAGGAAFVTALSLWALAGEGGVARTLLAALAALLAGGVLRVTSDALAGDTAPEQGRARFMGWFANASDLGTALAPALAYALAERFGIEAVYRMAAVLLAIGGGAVVLWLGRVRARAPAREVR